MFHQNYEKDKFKKLIELNQNNKTKNDKITYNNYKIIINFDIYITIVKY